MQFIVEQVLGEQCSQLFRMLQKPKSFEELILIKQDFYKVQKDLVLLFKHYFIKCHEDSFHQDISGIQAKLFGYRYCCIVNKQTQLFQKILRQGRYEGRQQQRENLRELVQKGWVIKTQDIYKANTNKLNYQIYSQLLKNQLSLIFTPIQKNYFDKILLQNTNFKLSHELGSPLSQHLLSNKTVDINSFIQLSVVAKLSPSSYHLDLKAFSKSFRQKTQNQLVQSNLGMDCSIVLRMLRKRRHCFQSELQKLTLMGFKQARKAAFQLVIKGYICQTINKLEKGYSVKYTLQEQKLTQTLKQDLLKTIKMLWKLSGRYESDREKVLKVERGLMEACDQYFRLVNF